MHHVLPAQLSSPRLGLSFPPLPSPAQNPRGAHHPSGIPNGAVERRIGFRFSGEGYGPQLLTDDLLACDEIIGRQKSTNTFGDNNRL